MKNFSLPQIIEYKDLILYQPACGKTWPLFCLIIIESE